MNTVHAMMKAPTKHYYEHAIMTLAYTELRPDSPKVAICVRNLLAGPIKVPAKQSYNLSVLWPLFLPYCHQKSKLMRTTKKRKLV